jgi:spore coat protein CotF
MQNQSNFTDKEQITDLLSCEKFLASSYNTFLLESATPEVSKCLSALLSDTHTMQQTIFTEMHSRGWYQTPKAEDTKLATTKQQFATSVTH